MEGGTQKALDNSEFAQLVRKRGRITVEFDDVLFPTSLFLLAVSLGDPKLAFGESIAKLIKYLDDECTGSLQNRIGRPGK